MALRRLLTELQDSFSAHQHMMSVFGGEPVTAATISTSFDADALKDYEQYYCTKDLWVIEGLKRKPPYVVLGEELVSDRVFSSSEVYNDHLLPKYDIRYVMASVEPMVGGGIISIALQRSPGSGGFDIADKQRFAQVSPMLRRMIRARLALQELTGVGRLALSALDQVPKGMVIVNRRGHVAFANRAANRLARRQELTFTQGPMDRTVGLPGDTPRDRLLAAIRAVADGALPSAELHYRSPRADVLRLVQILRLPPALRFGLPHGHALLVITTIEPPRAPAAERLVDALGLTPAEARLVCRLAEGQTLKGYAAASGVSLETVRTHLRAVFAKTGTARQADLLRLILAMT